MTIYKVNILDAKTGIVGRFGWFYNKESNRLKKNLEKYLFEHEEIEKDWRSGWKKIPNGYTAIFWDSFNFSLKYSVSIDTKKKIVTVE